jgi:CheY-like chemotaxis protein
LTRWSIVNKLGGKIEIRSEIGKGTDVEVTLPVEKEEAPKASSTRPGDLVKVSVDSEDCIDLLRRKAFGKSVSFSRSESLTPTARHKAVAWDCIAKYCSEWFGLEIKEAFGDVVISDQEDLTEHSQDQRTLIVHEDIAWSKQEQKSKHPLVGYICNPIGPFKLARSIMALIDREMPNDSINFRNRSDVSTQTLLGSLEERTMLNGMIMMDYGFSAPQSSSYTPGSSQASQGTEPHDSASQAQQQDDRGQAIAAIRSFSGMTLQLPERPKINPPETVDNSPEPASINPPSIPLPPSPTRTTSSPQTNTPSTNSLHILAVDDNAVNLQLLNRYLLKRKSDTIVTAINGVEALAAVRNPKKANFDVIFMDISMPEMDGFEATRLIRSFERSLAHRSVSEDNEYEDGNVVDGMVEKEMSRAYIVALTGLASRRDRDEAVECGFDDYLTKPISFGKIGELLKRLSAEKGIREGVDD